MAWAPWLTAEYVVNRVAERFGGVDAHFSYLGQDMVVKDVPKKVVRLPFVALVYFPSEALFVVTFAGNIL
ncbi:MAG: hypothetical protein HYU39_00585 [Thaumarchaeota archaeon]|nr:hypothetical protein [Nitrososphaerota archaeon]